MSNNIQYLCQPPKHDNYDELRDKVLSAMGTNSEKYIQDTIDFINKTHAIKVRTGRGRKSHGEHAILFYQYLLDYVQNHTDEMKQYDEKMKQLTSQKDKTGENNASTANVENANNKDEATDGGNKDETSDTPKDDKMKESSTTVMTMKQSEEGDNNSDEKKLDNNGHTNNGTKNNDVRGIKEQQEKKDYESSSDKPLLLTARQIALQNPDMVWCQFCKDDTTKVQLCVFCGCRNCYGKHHNDNLIQCIKCDEVHHTFCVDNPPTVVVGDIHNNKYVWYCTDCDRIIHNTADLDDKNVVLMDSTKLITVHTDNSGDIAVRRSKRCSKKPTMIDYEEPKKTSKSKSKKGSASSSRGMVQQSNENSQQTTTTKVQEDQVAEVVFEENNNNNKVDETEEKKETKSGITKDTKPQATKKKRGRPAKSEKRGKSSPTTILENAQGTTDQANKADNNEKNSQESDTIGQNGTTLKKRKRTAAATTTTTTDGKKNKDETTTTTEENTSKDQEETKEEAAKVNNDEANKMKTTQNNDDVIDESIAFDNSSHDMMGTDIVGTVTFGPAPTPTTTLHQGVDNSNDNNALSPSI